MSSAGDSPHDELDTRVGGTKVLPPSNDAENKTS
jgi:hypothetical protein